MRVFVTVFLLLFAEWYAVGQSGGGESWAKVKETGAGTIHVIYSAEPGIIYTDVDGKVKGVCTEILNDFVAFVDKHYNKKLTIKYLRDERNFVTFLTTVQNTPNLLGVSNTSVTEERKKVLKFTNPYLKSVAVMITNQKAASIKSLDELNSVFAGFSAEIIKGSTHEKFVEKLKAEKSPQLKINYSISSDNILKTLSENAKAFTVLDFSEYVGVVKKRLPIKRQEIDLGIVEEIGFIMSKQTDWDQPWNEFLTPEYRKSLRYKKIILDNLGAPFVRLIE